MAVTRYNQEMKKAWNGWQIIGTIAGVMVPFTMFLVSLTKTQASQATEIRELRSNQEASQLSNDKSFDKVNYKLDDQGKDIRQILIEMQNKQERPR